MEKSKKNLRDLSIVVLIFAALSLIRVIVSFILSEEVAKAELPEGMTVEVVEIAIIVLFIVSLICLIPQIYVGFKGLRMAKSPDKSRAHIVWAIILLVFSVIAVATPITELIDARAIFDNILELVDCLLDIIVFALFIKYAKEIRATVI